MKLLTSKKMKLQKEKNLGKQYSCRISILKKDERCFEVLNYKQAICTIENGIATDVLLEDKPQYKVFIGKIGVKKALDEGKLTNNEAFCFDAEDVDEVFPNLKDMSTNEDKIEFLKDYQRKHKKTLYWSFLDKDEIKEIDERIEKNRQIYIHSMD